MRVMIYGNRAYYVMPGKMPALHERFSKVTMPLFKRHRMQVVGFWETVIGESNELVYILAFEDLAHRERAWQAFYADPEWQKARRASEAGGPLIERIVNKIWKPTPYSPLK